MGRKTPAESPKSTARVKRKPNTQRPVRAQPARTERLNARISPDDQVLLAKVAGMRGVSVSTFVIQAARARARALLRRQKLIRLSARDEQALISALLSPPVPNARLMRAATVHARELARRVPDKSAR